MMKSSAIANCCLALAGILTAALSGCSGGTGEATVFPQVGGIESVSVDGQRYFFGYSSREDRVLTPLFPTANLIAEHAATHLAQRDGRHDKPFWLAQAQHSVGESDLADRAARVFALGSFRDAVRDLRRDPGAARALPGLVVPEHLLYLLIMNCAWPDELAPVDVQSAAQRLGLEADDVSPWLEESASMLSGRSDLPGGASFQDAARVFLWYYDVLVTHQRHGWAEQLGLA